MKAGATLLLFAAMLWGAWFLLKPKAYPAGILIANEPAQTPVPPASPAFSKAGFTLHPLANYDIAARLLHKKRYYSDAVAALAPFDFAVGWGPMSDQAVLDQLKISQGNRFFFWEYLNAPPLPPAEMIDHASNMHLIPADARVWLQLWCAHTGDLIRLRGCLIEADAPGCPPWRSSLSRTDTGNGACEIMWVQSFEKL